MRFIEILNYFFRSSFFYFCNDERSKVKAENPGASVGEIAKLLGKRWETCKNKSKYEELAKKDKERYAKVICFFITIMVLYTDSY